MNPEFRLFPTSTVNTFQRLLRPRNIPHVGTHTKENELVFIVLCLPMLSLSYRLSIKCFPNLHRKVLYKGVIYISANNVLL